MKSKIIFPTILIIFSLISVSGIALANNTDNHKSEIEEGRELTESKVSCEQLTDEQLEAVGEYLMEQMHPGESHEAMHKMMNMEEGTEYHKNFHINIAKTMYCGEGGTTSMMPMMKIMGGGGNSMIGNMMTGNNLGMMAGWGWFGWIFMILFWVLIIVGVIALIKWLIKEFNSKSKEKPALDILKERYAKGEIDKKEFEEKKKDLI